MNGHRMRTAWSGLRRSAGLALMAAAALWPGLSGAQGAVAPQARIIVPTPAGGPLDVLARAMALAWHRLKGETLLVDNRPGAGGAIGTEAAVRAAADGRTLQLGSGFLATNSVLSKTPFDPQTDLRPVLELSQAGMLLAVRRELPVATLDDLVELARRTPQGLNCGAPTGDLSFGCEQMREALGAPVVAIPYPGLAPAMNALSGGQVDFLFSTYDAALPLAEGKRIRVIAHAGTSATLPPFDSLPLLKDRWPGLDVVGFIGIFVPAKTPDEVVAALHRELLALMRDPQMAELMRARGSQFVPAGPEKLGQTLAERVALYRRLAPRLAAKAP